MKPDFTRREMLNFSGAAGGSMAALGLMGTSPVFANSSSDEKFVKELFPTQKAKLDAFIKAEGDTSGDEMVLYGVSNVFSYIHGQQDRKLFDIELYAVRRYYPVEGGWVRLHREAGAFRNAETGKIMTKWYNPFLEREVEIIDLFQTFNRRYLAANLGKTWNVNASRHGNDLFFQRNFFLSEEAEIQPAEYPLHGSASTFDLSEYIHIFTTMEAINDPTITMAPAFGITNSVGNWLPWMEMGTRPGYLVHQTRFVKLDSVDKMPEDVKAYVRERDAKYLTAPTEFKERDEHGTSLVRYKRIIDERRARTAQ